MAITKYRVGESRWLYRYEEVGRGEIAYVYRAAFEEDMKRRLALKLPRSIGPEGVGKLVREAEVINEIRAHFPGVSRPPLPDYAEMLELFDPDTGTERRGLVMEWIAAPQLFDVYQGLADPAREKRDLRALNAAEKIAWEATRQYFRLLRVQMAIGVATSDRKRDTFYWDVESAALIVMDWNAFDRVHYDEEVARNAVRLWAQNWYTMLTRRDAIDLPGRFQDEAWGDISLFARDLMTEIIQGRRGAAAIMSGSETTPDGVFKAIEDRIESWLKEFDLLGNDRMLSQAFLHHPLRKQQDREDVARAEVEQFLDLADRVRRYDVNLYDEADRDFQRVFDRYFSLLGGKESARAAITLAAPAGLRADDPLPVDYYVTLLIEFRKFIEKNHQNLSTNLLIEECYTFISNMNDALMALQRGEWLDTRLDEFLATLKKVFGGEEIEKSLIRLTRWLNVYRALVAVRQTMRLGVPDHDTPIAALLKTRLEALLAFTRDFHYAEVCHALDIDGDVIAAIAEHFDGNTPKRIDWRKRFIDACDPARPDARMRLREDIEIFIGGRDTHPEAIRTARSYLDALETAESFLDDPTFMRTELPSRLRSLRDFVDSFPELREWACGLPVMLRAQVQYERMAAASKDRGGIVLTERALQFAMLLQPFFITDKGNA